MTDNEIIKVGDICLYFYDNDNKSISIVEVVKYLSTDVLVVKFLQVVVDDSGNGLFDYLYRAEKTMNVSRKYLHKINLINRQQAEIERLKIENQSLRGAANSYKLHYENAVKNFEEFAQHAYIDNPFACQYCVHSVANGRACLWKEEHEKDGVSCLGKHFKYYSNKMVGDTE